MKRIGFLITAAAVMGLGFMIGLVLLASGIQQPPQCAPGQSLQVHSGDLPPEVAGFSGEQVQNAATIMRVGADLGVDARGQTVAVMTAIGESNLNVLDHGDAAGPDSRGLFQQRAGGRWGSYADRMDPARSAAMFFDGLLEVEGWQDMPATMAAHRVQRNADPRFYENYWTPAVEVVTSLSVHSSTLTTAEGAKRYELGPVKPHTQMLAEEVGALFDISDIGGYRQNAVDQGGHPAGLAVDIMTYEDRALGEQMASYVLENATRLSVDYVIWQQAIWRAGDPGAGWQAMVDRGTPSANHLDHLHVNVTSTPSGEGGGPRAVADCITASLAGPGPGEDFSSEWVVPVDGPLTSGYGLRWGAFHAGTDIGAACRTPIYAAAGGVVVFAGPGPHPRYGITGHVIVLDHGGGLETTYNHMFAWGVGVAVGDRVPAGALIGHVGEDGNATGCHLHFGVYRGGQHTNPAPFMTDKGARLG